jgi:DNA-binding PadR family transcriptional regulator
MSKKRGELALYITSLLSHKPLTYGDLKSKIGQKYGVGDSTIAYVLSSLQKTGEIKSAKIGPAVFYFLPSHAGRIAAARVLLQDKLFKKGACYTAVAIPRSVEPALILDFYVFKRALRRIRVRNVLGKYVIINNNFSRILEEEAEAFVESFNLSGLFTDIKKPIPPDLLPQLRASDDALEDCIAKSVFSLLNNLDEQELNDFLTWLLTTVYSPPLDDKTDSILDLDIYSAAKKLAELHARYRSEDILDFFDAIKYLAELPVDVPFSAFEREVINDIFLYLIFLRLREKNEEPELIDRLVASSSISYGVCDYFCTKIEQSYKNDLDDYRKKVKEFDDTIKRQQKELLQKIKNNAKIIDVCKKILSLRAVHIHSYDVSETAKNDEELASFNAKLAKLKRYIKAGRSRNALAMLFGEIIPRPFEGGGVKAYESVRALLEFFKTNKEDDLIATPKKEVYITRFVKSARGEGKYKLMLGNKVVALVDEVRVKVLDYDVMSCSWFECVPFLGLNPALVLQNPEAQKKSFWLRLSRKIDSVLKLAAQHNLIEEKMFIFTSEDGKTKKVKSYIPIGRKKAF